MVDAIRRRHSVDGSSNAAIAARDHRPHPRRPDPGWRHVPHDVAGGGVAMRAPDPAPDRAPDRAQTSAFSPDLEVIPLDAPLLHRRVDVHVFVTNHADLPGGDWVPELAVAGEPGLSRIEVDPRPGRAGLVGTVTGTVTSWEDALAGVSLTLRDSGAPARPPATLGPYDVPRLRAPRPQVRHTVQVSPDGGRLDRLRAGSVVTVTTEFENVWQPRRSDADHHLATTELTDPTDVDWAGLDPDLRAGITIDERDSGSFSLTDPRWDEDRKLEDVWCVGAGTATLSLRTSLAGRRSETTRALAARITSSQFADRCDTADIKHGQILGVFENWLEANARTFRAAHDRVLAALRGDAWIDQVQKEILLGALVTGLGGAVGGFLGTYASNRLLSSAAGQARLAALVSAGQAPASDVGAALVAATRGAITDAMKDPLKFTARLPWRLTRQTLYAGDTGATSVAAAGLDPLAWSSLVRTAINSERIRVASALVAEKNQARIYEAQGGTVMTDVDPVAMVVDTARVTTADGGYGVSDLSVVPEAVWEARIWAMWMAVSGWGSTLTPHWIVSIPGHSLWGMATQLWRGGHRTTVLEDGTRGVPAGLYEDHTWRTYSFYSTAEMSRVAKALVELGGLARADVDAWVTAIQDLGRDAARERARQEHARPP